MVSQPLSLISGLGSVVANKPVTTTVQMPTELQMCNSDVQKVSKFVEPLHLNTNCVLQPNMQVPVNVVTGTTETQVYVLAMQVSEDEIVNEKRKSEDFNIEDGKKGKDEKEQISPMREPQ